MSADSFIPLAIAGAFFFAAPIVIAGLAVAGAAAAVSVVAQTAANASRKAAAEQASRQREQQARLARQSAEDQSRPSARFKAAIRLCRAVSVPLPTRSAKTSRRPRRRPPVNYTLPARPPPKMPPACSVLLRQKPRRFPINGAPRMTPCWPSTVPTCTHRFRRPARSWKPARQT